MALISFLLPFKELPIFVSFASFLTMEYITQYQLFVLRVVYLFTWEMEKMCNANAPSNRMNQWIANTWNFNNTMERWLKLGLNLRQVLDLQVFILFIVSMLQIAHFLLERKIKLNTFNKLFSPSFCLGLISASFHTGEKNH